MKTLLLTLCFVFLTGCAAHQIGMSLNDWQNQTWPKSLVSMDGNSEVWHSINHTYYFENGKLAQVMTDPGRSSSDYGKALAQGLEAGVKSYQQQQLIQQQQFQKGFDLYNSMRPRTCYSHKVLGLTRTRCY